MFQTKIERYLSILRNFLCSETFLSPAICNGKRTGEKFSFPLIISVHEGHPKYQLKVHGIERKTLFPEIQRP